MADWRFLKRLEDCEGADPHLRELAHNILYFGYKPTSAEVAELIAAQLDGAV